MQGKKTKGKKKINIRKFENEEDRMVAFSKRKSGIYSNFSELSILCGANVGFLAYSNPEKPYTFGNPSFEAVAERLVNIDHPFINGEGSSVSSVVDAHKKVKMDELCKTVNNLRDEADAEEEKGKKAVLASSLPIDSDAWWKVDPENDEAAKQQLEKFEQFYETLSEVAAAKNRARKSASKSS